MSEFGVVECPGVEFCNLLEPTIFFAKLLAAALVIEMTTEGRHLRTFNNFVFMCIAALNLPPDCYMLPSWFLPNTGLHSYGSFWTNMVIVSHDANGVFLRISENCQIVNGWLADSQIYHKFT